MKFWQALSFSEPEQLVDLAKIAEEVGFEGVLVSDHLFFPQKLESGYPYSDDGAPVFGPDSPFPDPWVALGAMSAVTTRLRFSMIVYILPLRHPLEVAKATATLAVMSGDRFALGAGAGWMKEEFTQLGVDFHTRGKRFDEMIAVLQTIWQGGMVEHHGCFFDFDPIEMSPAPKRPIPIWVGGKSKPALRRAAVLGDGWIGPGSTPEEVPQQIAALHALRREAGRTDGPFETIVPLKSAPELDAFKRMEDAGVTSTVSYPLAFTLGPTSTLDAKHRVLEQFAEQFIRPSR